MKSLKNVFCIVLGAVGFFTLMPGNGFGQILTLGNTDYFSGVGSPTIGGNLGLAEGIDTVGQTFVVPTNGYDTLTSFTFFLRNAQLSGSYIYANVYLYAWNVHQITGNALYSSAAPGVYYTNDHFDELTFNTGAIQLNPGSEYILFMTLIDGVGSGLGEVGHLLGDYFDGGRLFYSYANYFPELYDDWLDFGGPDMAFKTTLTPSSVPEPTAPALVLLGIAALWALRSYQQKRSKP